MADNATSHRAASGGGTIIDQLVASAAEKSTREIVEDAYAAGLLAGARAIADLLDCSEDTA
jgi:hypothetical protein